MKQTLLIIVIFLASFTMNAGNLYSSNDVQDCHAYAARALDLEEAAYGPMTFQEAWDGYDDYYELCQLYGDTLADPIFV